MLPLDLSLGINSPHSLVSSHSSLSRSALFVHGTSPAGRVEWEESDMNGEEPRNTLETERKFDGFYNRKIPKDI